VINYRDKPLSEHPQSLLADVRRIDQWSDPASYPPIEGKYYPAEDIRRDIELIDSYSYIFEEAEKVLTTAAITAVADLTMTTDWAQLAWPVLLVAATLSASSVRSWLSSARSVKETVSGKDRLARALNVPDVTLRTIIQDPSVALASIDVSKIDINTVIEALATHTRLLENAEEALEAAATRLEILEKSADTDAIDAARTDLQAKQKELTELQEMSDALQIKVSSAARRIDILRRTTQPEAAARRTARLAEYLHQVTTALSGKGTITLDDVVSVPDTTSSQRTDELGEPLEFGFTFVPHSTGYQYGPKELPAPEGDKFGHMPSLAPTIPRHKIAKPAEFDGTYAKYHSWAIGVLGYVQYMAVSFTEPLGVLLVFQAATVLGSPARRTMDALYLACMATDGAVRKEFDQLTTAMQTARWIGSKMDKVYFDHLAWDNAMDRIKAARQGPLRQGSWLKFWQVIDEARNTLRLPDSETKHYVMNNMNQELLMEINLKAGWKRSQMTLNYILDNAVAMEDQVLRKNRAHHSEEGLAGSYRKRQEEKKDRKRGRETSLVSTTSSKDHFDRTNVARRRLSSEDFELVRKAKACWTCWRTGHTAQDCTRGAPHEMTDTIRERLRREAQEPRTPGREATRATTGPRAQQQRENKKALRAQGVSFEKETESRFEELDSEDEE
jgi:hypothetical protein